MKPFQLISRHLFFLILGLSFFLTSCEAIEGIFKTGFWAGAIFVLLIVGFVFYIIMRSKSNRNS